MIGRTTLTSMLLAAACTYHVAIPAPAPTLTPEQRVAFFTAHEPAKISNMHISRDGGDTWELANTSVSFADHTEVVAPEDLDPLVAPDSETARAAARSVVARDRDILTRVAMFALFTAGFFFAGGFSTFDHRPWNASPWLGWPVMIGSVLIGYPLGRHYAHEELAERRAAFAHYTRDLGDRLNLCAHDMQVVPCETPLTASLHMR